MGAAIRVAMTSWICSRRGPNTASDPGVLVGRRPVRPVDFRAPGQRGNGASELLEPGAGKPDLEILKRNGAIGTSCAHERFGECGDLHWVSSICCQRHCARPRPGRHRGRSSTPVRGYTDTLPRKGPTYVDPPNVRMTSPGPAD